MNKLPIFAAMLTATAAGIAGYLLIPGPLEQVTMLMRDGNEDIALIKADELIKSGLRDPGLLMQDFLLNERFGNRERAMASLHAYFEIKPDDAAAWRKAADTFAGADNLEGRLEALENIVKLTHDAETVGELTRLYRLHARFDDEVRVFRSVDPLTLHPTDAVRFASLLLSKNEGADAITIFRRIDDQKKLDSNDQKMMFFNALVVQRDFDEAAQRALVWQSNKDAEPLVDVFIRYLLRAGADGPAMRLGMQENWLSDPIKMTRLSQLLADEGRYELLESILIRWLDHARELPADGLDSYLRIVVDIGRQKGLDNQLFRQFFLALETRGSSDVKASFLQAMYNQYGYPGIAPYRQFLGPDVLAARPVMAARVLMQERNVLIARHFLLGANLLTLSSQDRFDWLATAQWVLTPDELVAELSQRVASGTVPHEMKRAFLEVAMKQGSQPQLAAIWSSFFEQNRAVKSDRHVLNAEGTL